MYRDDLQNIEAIYPLSPFRASLPQAEAFWKENLMA
jgi:hypothetical protein